MSVLIPHTRAYSGSSQPALAERTADGGVKIDDIGYYEESITLTPEHVRLLGFFTIEPRPEYDPTARDDAMPCLVPRSLLRRAYANLVGFAAFAEAACPTGSGEREAADEAARLIGHPGMAARIERAKHVAAAIAAAGQITDDEDLDD